jgi:hypothetical protein
MQQIIKMINNLNDLEYYCKQLERSDPEDAIEYNFTVPGISVQEIVILTKNLPYINTDYLRCASLFQLKNIVLGYFYLSPSFGKELSLSELVLRANGPLNPFMEFFQEMNLVEVASYEADPIVVHKDGGVFMFNHEDLTDFSLMAENFTLFLLAVGNLHELQGEIEGQPAIDEFFRRLRVLEFTENIIENWRIIAQMTYLD